MPVEKIEIVSREQWLALRKQDVTASRVGALFSAHPYATALRLYLEHCGIEFPDQEETGVMRRGRLLEGAVGLAVAEQRSEWTIVKNKYYFRDPELRLGATPDFFIEGDERGLGILQTKTAAPIVFERDWESGRTVPVWIMLQCLVECMLTDARFGVVAAMRVDPWDLACPIIEIPRHLASELKIINAVSQFWKDVAEGREPPPDYNKDAGLLAVLYPQARKDTVVDLSGHNELPGMLEQRHYLKQQIKAYEARCEEIDTELRFAIRDAERVEGIDGWKITNKNVHRDAYQVDAKDYRSLHIARRDHD